MRVLIATDRKRIIRGQPDPLIVILEENRIKVPDNAKNVKEAFEKAEVVSDIFIGVPSKTVYSPKETIRVNGLNIHLWIECHAEKIVMNNGKCEIYG